MKLTQDMTIAAWNVLSSAQVNKPKLLKQHRRLFQALKEGCCKLIPAQPEQRDAEGNVTKPGVPEGWERNAGEFSPEPDDLKFFQQLYTQAVERGIPGHLVEVWAQLGDAIEEALQTAPKREQEVPAAAK